MKLYLSLFTLILLLTTSINHADDYVWGEEFKEGDIISAATFNQIFSTLQKLNRTPKDSDLVGTWSCSSVWAGTSSSAGLTQDSTNTWLFSLAGAQLTMTASSESSSFPTGYTFSTSSPNQFVSLSSAAAVSGTYVLFNNLMISKGILSGNNYITHTVDIVSDDRIIFSTNNTSSNLAKVVVCDSAVPVPAAPTSTTATNAQTTVNVTWTDQSSDETGFKIYRRLSTATEATQLATAVTASPYVDSTLTEGQTAYYSVSAYNANGESAKSKIVSATLDSVKPTVSSHSPTANQQVTNTSRTVSITFSEAVKVICPGEGNAWFCSTAGSAITAVGTSKTYGYFASVGTIGLALSGNIVGSAETLNASDTITVTVHKEWIQDVNGNPMAADYTYTFTVGT
jgi:hypothetical protein